MPRGYWTENVYASRWINLVGVVCIAGCLFVSYAMLINDIIAERSDRFNDIITQKSERIEKVRLNANDL